VLPGLQSVSAYITVRTGGAMMTANAYWICLVHLIINWLRSRQARANLSALDVRYTHGEAKHAQQWVGYYSAGLISSTSSLGQSDKALMSGSSFLR